MTDFLDPKKRDAMLALKKHKNNHHSNPLKTFLQFVYHYLLTG